MIQQSLAAQQGSFLVTDYDYDIQGTRDGFNQTFTTSVSYVPGTTRVYLNGHRQTPDKHGLQTLYDYFESGENAITFHFIIRATDVLIIEYKPIS